MFNPFSNRRTRRAQGESSAAGETNLSASVVVLGAGFAGASVALELAALGHSVLLVDRNARPLARTHRRHVGKIELGFADALPVANAGSAHSVDAALAFGATMARWLDAPVTTSMPFQYWIRDNEDAIGAFVGRCESIDKLCIERLNSDPEASYLELRPERFWTPPCGIHDPVGGERYRIFETEERAIDTDILALRLADRIHDDPEIRFEGNVEVGSVERTDDGFRVVGERFGRVWSAEAAILVNATQHNRTALDQCLGIATEGTWLRRVQVRLIVRLPQSWVHMHSITLPTPPFGDVVVRGDGTAYVSWIPAEGTIDDTTIAEWTRSKPDVGTAFELSQRVLADYDTVLPGFAAAQTLQVDCTPKLIASKQDSQEENASLGYTDHEGYVTLDPGTLTTGTYRGVNLARAVAAKLAGIPPTNRQPPQA